MNPGILNDRRILVADDDKSSFLYIEAILEKTGAKLFWVENGLQAVEFVKSKPNVDVVLMDLEMPVMNGKEAISYIKVYDNSLPIVVQSCDVTKYKTDNPKMNDNIWFLEKPYKSDNLMEVIFNALNMLD